VSEEYTEGDWVLWQCRNGVEIAARRTAVQDDTKVADDTMLVWMIRRGSAAPGCGTPTGGIQSQALITRSIWSSRCIDWCRMVLRSKMGGCVRS
jgi:hypothetical protein